jgi:hypothetical protein
MEKDGVAGADARLKRIDEIRAVCTGVVRRQQAGKVRLLLCAGVVPRVDVIHGAARSRFGYGTCPGANHPLDRRCTCRRIGIRETKPDFVRRTGIKTKNAARKHIGRDIVE